MAKKEVRLCVRFFQREDGTNGYEIFKVRGWDYVALCETYERAIEELRRGHKTSHWMWFVFPQIAGLGQSPTSRTFAISSLEEAKAYLRHPVLGPRLIDCAGIVANARPGTAPRNTVPASAKAR